MIRDVLELHGYSVVTAADGQQALREIATIEHVCVVILDLIMPVMNGWDFFATLRARPELASIPVVVHSSAPDAPREGVAHVLQKPLRLQRLLSVVREYCAG